LSLITKLPVARAGAPQLGPRGGNNRRPPDFRGSVSIAFMPDSLHMITGSPDSIIVWRTANWTEEATLPGGAGAIALSQAGSRLASESERAFFTFGGPVGRGQGGGIRVWDTASWKLITTMPSASGPLALSADGKMVAAQSDAGIIVRPLDVSGKDVLLQ